VFDGTGVPVNVLAPLLMMVMTELGPEPLTVSVRGTVSGTPWVLVNPQDAGGFASGR